MPQALEGVAAVGAAVRDGPAMVRRRRPALLAGAVLALTPVAALMFRFNNPDALLALVLTARPTPWSGPRSGQHPMAGARRGAGRVRVHHQDAAGPLVVPGLRAWPTSSPRPTPLGGGSRQLPRRRRRPGGVRRWWVAAVQLTPAADRPYIGGSQNNSLLNLIFGYNGFGRLTGNESGSVGGGPGGGAGGARPGCCGCSTPTSATQASWLLPAALILLVAGLALTWRRRPDRPSRAALHHLGRLAARDRGRVQPRQGIIHPYYTVALAPAIGALVGIGVDRMWARRDRGRAASSPPPWRPRRVWSYVLLDRTPSWHPWLRQADLVGRAGPSPAGTGRAHWRGRLSRLVAARHGLAALRRGRPPTPTPPLDHAPQRGYLRRPAVAQAGAGPGSARGRGGAAFGPGAASAPAVASAGRPRARCSGQAPCRVAGGAGRGSPGAEPGRRAGRRTLRPRAPAVRRAGFGPRVEVAVAVPAAPAGCSMAARPRAAVTAGLQSGSSQLHLGRRHRRVQRGQSGYQLATGQAGHGHRRIQRHRPGADTGPVRADVRPGGSTTSSPAAGFGGGEAQGPRQASQITTWVESNFGTKSVGGVTFYDLTAPVPTFDSFLAR